MTRFTLTVRNGPAVSRERFERLDEAIVALRAHVTSIREEGTLPEVSALRTFEPGDRVKARLELSAGRIFRRREAGLDLMGDGNIVAYSGGAFKRPLEPDSGEDAYDAIANTLRE